jgi:WD40 repeat protein
MRTPKIIHAVSLSLVLFSLVALAIGASRKPPTELYVKTEPPAATVLVDGKELGTSPEVFEVEPGAHTVTVTLAGHEPIVQEVRITDGRIKRVILELQKAPKAVAGSDVDDRLAVAKPVTAPVASPQPKLSARKLFSTTHGADAGILAVAFSPDGRTIAAVDELGKVVLCDARTSKRTMSFNLLSEEERWAVVGSSPDGKIHSGGICFSPDGKTLAVGGGPLARLYDAATGRLRFALEDKTLFEELKPLLARRALLEKFRVLAAVPHAHGNVHSVAFSPDSALLATSGGDILASGATPGQIKLWDAKTGELKRDLGEHFSAVRSVAFSSDGKVLASAGMHPPRWTKSVRLWDPLTGSVKSVLSVPRGDAWSIAFSPDGKLLAAGGIIHEEDDSTSGTLLVWNAKTGALLISRPLPGGVSSVAFSADGQTLATGEYDRGVTLWDPETAKRKFEVKPQTDLLRDLKGMVRVAFSPTGSLLAIGAEHEKHGFVTVWQIHSGTALMPNTSTKTSGTPPEPKPRKTEPLSFGPVIERVVNDHRVGRDYLIDLDTGKLYTRPENLHNLEELHAWARRVGIDASGVLASEGVLAGSEIGAAIVDGASWEEVTPQAVREALKQPDPRLAVRREDAPTMIRLGGKGVSPERVYAFETREGGVGVLQLVGTGDKDHRSVKIRYKLVSGTSSSPPADHVWTCPMHPQVKVPKPGKCPICAMDLVVRPPRSAAEQAVRELISNFVEAATRGDKDSVAKFLSKRSHHILEHTREIMLAGMKVAEISFVIVAHGRALAVTDFAQVPDPESKAVMCVVYTVVKQGDRWVIEDIDLADPNGLSDEISDLQAEPDQDESTQPSKKVHLPDADPPG